MAKVESAKCRDNSSFVAIKPKESGRMNVATIEALSQHILRRMPEKKTELCRDTT